MMMWGLHPHEMAAMAQCLRSRILYDLDREWEAQADKMQRLKS